MRNCALKSCKSKTGSGYSLFLLPEDSETRKMWWKFIEYEGGSKVCGNFIYICELHFKKSKISQFATRKVLDKDAYPTIGCAGKIYDHHSLTTCEQQTTVLHESPVVPVSPPHSIVVLKDEKFNFDSNIMSSMFDSIRDSRKEVKELLVKNLDLNSSLEAAQQKEKLWKEKYLKKDEDLKQVQKNLSKYFGKSQIEIIGGKSRNNVRWDDKSLEKMAALKENIGERSMKLLNDNFFPTPHPSTIRRHLREFKFEPGTQIINMRALKRKAEILNLPDYDKKMVIGFDEKHIVPGIKIDPATKKLQGIATLDPTDAQLLKNPEKVATHGQIYLAMGVIHRFKEILGYDFTSNSTDPEAMMKRIFNLIVQSENETGIEVIAIVMDMGPCNIAFLNYIGIRIRKVDPVYYVPHPNDPARKLYVILDPVHLLKNLTCGLRRHDVLFSDKIINENNLSSPTAQFQDIEKLYEQQKETEIKFAPELTNEVMNPSHFESMKEEIAYKLIAPNVSLGLDIIFKDVPGKNSTAFYLETLNRLKDICTSDNGWNKASWSNYNDDVTFLKYLALDFFPNINYKMTRGTLKSIDGAIVSLLAIIDMSAEIFNGGAEKFYPKHVLNNAVENQFAQITQRYQKVDAIEFKRALKSNSIKNFQKPVRGASYKFEKDDDDENPTVNFIEIIKEVSAESKSQNDVEELFEVPEISLPNSISDTQLFPSHVNRVAFHQKIAEILIEILPTIECQECLENFQLIPLDESNFQLSEKSLNFFSLMELCYRSVAAKMTLNDSRFKDSFITNSMSIADCGHCPAIQDVIIEKFFTFRFRFSMKPRQKHNINKFSSKSLSK